MRTAVDLLLAARQPVYVAWGPELTSLYNDGYIPILGIKHPDGLGQPYAALFAEIWEEYRPLVAATLAGEAQHVVDRPVALVGRGDALPLSYFTFSWTPLRDDGGQVAGFYCAATETTAAAKEALRVAEALRASEEMYRTLFASIDEGFCIIELLYEETGRAVDYRFLAANRAFERQTGLVVVTGALGSAVAPGTESAWLDAYGEVARAGAARRMEYYHHPTRRWYTAYIARVGDAGRGRVCIVFADVTERKEREERQAFLLRLSDALRPLADPLAIRAEAARTLGEALGVNRAFYAEVAGAEWLVARGYERGVAPQAVGRHPMAPFGPWIVGLLRAGDTLIIRDLPADARFAPSERAAHAAYHMLGAVAGPLVKAGTLVAILVVHSAVPATGAPTRSR